MAQFLNKIDNIMQNTDIALVKHQDYLSGSEFKIENNNNNYQDSATCATKQTLSIKSLLILNNSHNSKDYYFALYEERISIMHFDGNIDLNEAKKAAFDEIISHYLENELLLKGATLPPKEQYLQVTQTLKRWGINS